MGEEDLAVVHCRRSKAMRTISKTEPSARASLPLYSKRKFLILLFAALSCLYVLIYGVQQIDVKEVFKPHPQHAYGPPQWVDNSPPEKCKCGSADASCSYSTSGNQTQNLTGAAFPCSNPIFFDKAAPTRKVSFAVWADSELLSQLLVLIGSIHKYYKEIPILVYDTGNLRQQKKHLRGILANIRNVEVVVADDLIRTDQQQTDGVEMSVSAKQPFLMFDSIKKYEEVYWMSPLHEIISDLILEYPSDYKFTTYIRIGPRSAKDYKRLDFATYFPFLSLTARNCSFRYIQNSRQTRQILFWLAKCAQTADCWRCTNVDSEEIDCLPFLESRLSEDYDMPLISDHRYTALDQKWSAPECGWRCALSSLAAIFTFVLLTASLLFVISARFVAD